MKCWIAHGVRRAAAAGAAVSVQGKRTWALHGRVLRVKNNVFFLCLKKVFFYFLNCLWVAFKIFTCWKHLQAVHLFRHIVLILVLDIKTIKG